MLYKQFYSELGKLLYAAANIDGVITQKEKNVLLDIVQKELMPSEKREDKYGTNLAHYTEIEFEFLKEQKIDSESAFTSFVNFVEEHHSAFDEKLIKVCLKVIKEMALAYHGINQKEKRMINKLKNIIDKIEVRR